MTEHKHHHESDMTDKKTPQQIYILDNLGCANCAAKMEKIINDLAEVERATITFATKELRVTTKHSKHILEELQAVCASIEDGVIVRAKEDKEKHKASKNSAELCEIGVAIILFIVGICLKNTVFYGAIACFVAAYLLLGAKILWAATRNLFRGHVFDENFLMSIATLAAFVIGEYAEAVGVMLFFRIGELFEKMAVEKSRSQIMDAIDLRPETVQIMHEHGAHTIPAKEANIGDILMVRVGDRIPLDAVVVEGESRVDTSTVTGEPIPVKVTVGDKVISGCVNTSGVLKIRVEKTLEQSMVTRILNSVENAAAGKPKVDRFITRFARVYTPFVVLLSLMTAFIPSIITGNWSHWIYTAITFLVISCPCALVLSVPLAFFSGIGVGSKKRILFKGGLAMEILQQVRAVVLDKTGTITKGVFEIQKCVPTREKSENEVLFLAAICELQSTHPIAQSIVKEAQNRKIEIPRADSVEEIAGKGIRASWGDKEILCGNSALLEQYDIQNISKQDERYGTEVFVACDGNIIGYIVISDTLKEDAKETILQLSRQNVRTVMLTGDAKESAEAIAMEIGIDEVHAKLMPDEKLQRMKEIRSKHGKVMFVGDGINDAPVLAGADVGAAMGSGADAAIEAADVVFMTASLQAIVESIKIAKETNRVAKQNIIFALAMKALVMVLGFAGLANMWMAVFADTGVAMICILNSIRILRRK